MNEEIQKNNDSDKGESLSERGIIKNSKWIDNKGSEVEEVFGFNESAELVNGRAAMIGFIMLILTEIVFHGRPVTSAIFGIN